MLISIWKKITTITLLVTFIASATFFPPKQVVAMDQFTLGVIKGASSCLAGLGANAGLSALNKILLKKHLAELAKQKAEEKAEEAAAKAAGLSKVPVISSDINAKIDKTNEALKKQTQETEKITMKTCIDAVGRSIADGLLKKITFDTIAWINTGFEGDPLFVQDIHNYSLSVTQEDLRSITESIGFDQVNFPYGRDLARAIAKSWVNGEEDYLKNNAAYSLNKFIGHNKDKEFDNNFSVGGWNGLIGKAFYPGNNPIGFRLEASKEVIRTTAKLDEVNSNLGSVLTDLKLNQGFQSIRKCVKSSDGTNDYVHDTAQQKLAEDAVKEAQAGVDDVIELKRLGGADDNDVANARAVLAARLKEAGKYSCASDGWEVQTPGGFIADRLTSVVDIPQNRLLNAQDINESIAAIMDALISKIFQVGIVKLGGGDLLQDQSYKELGGYGSNTGSSTLNGGFLSDNYSSGDGPPTQNQIDDLYTVINRPNTGIIPQQQKYITALQDQNIELNKLLQLLYQLDFCIPGPNPSWQDGVKTMVDNITQTSWVLHDGDSQAARDQYFPDEINNLIGVKPTGISTSSDTKNFMDSIIGQYDAFIKLNYEPAPTDGSILEAHGLTTGGQSLREIARISEYKQKISDNDAEINNTNIHIQDLITLNNNIQATQQNNLPVLTSFLLQLNAMLPNLASEADVEAVNTETQSFITSTKPNIIAFTTSCESIVGTNGGGAYSGMNRRLPYIPTTSGTQYTPLTNTYAPGKELKDLSSQSFPGSNFSTFEKQLKVY